MEYQIKQLEFELSQEKALGLSSAEVSKMKSSLETLKNKLVSLNQQKDKLNQSDNGFSVDIEKAGSSMEKLIGKVGRWALAVFGIRSAYSAVRSAMSTLSQYNEQLATDIEYIKYALAKTLEPIIQGLIQLVYTLLTYVNYLAQAWFGVNLFANSSASAFADAKKSTGGMVKDSEKMNKSLSKLDEITNLEDNSSSASGGGSGITMPGTDLGNMNIEVPSWLVWIKDNGMTIAAILAGIAAGIIAVKLGATSIQALGIGIIVAGIVLLIKDILKFLKDPTWEKFGKILTDVGIILAGIAILVGSIPIAIAAAIAIIVGLVITNWDKIKGILSSAWSWIQSTFGRIKDFFVSVGSSIGNAVASAFKAVINAVLSYINTVINTPIRSINSLIGIINKVPGINLGKLNTITLPRLARGGVVNMPGKGVNIGGAIAGESGAEAVIPLQNSQYANAFAQQIADKVGGGLSEDLLIELNRNILELANRPIEMNINGTKFAQATFKSYQQEGNRLNQSTTIKVS